MYQNTSLYVFTLWELWTGQRTKKMSNVIVGKSPNQLGNPTHSPLTSTYSPLWFGDCLKGSLNKTGLILQNWPSSSPWPAFVSQWPSQLNQGVLKRTITFCTSAWTRKTNPWEFLQIYTGAFHRNPLTFTAARLRGSSVKLISLGWWVITELEPTGFSSAWWVGNLGLSQELCSPLLLKTFHGYPASTVVWPLEQCFSH